MFTHKVCFLSVKYDFSHLKLLWFTPIKSSLVNRSLKFTLSNSLLKFVKITSVSFRWKKAAFVMDVNWSTLVVVEQPFRKSCRWGDNNDNNKVWWTKKIGNQFLEHFWNRIQFCNAPIICNIKLIARFKKAM